MKIGIYIPSKGRAAETTTPDLLLADGLKFKIVVEPSYDHYHYSKRFGDDYLLVLPYGRKGQAYVREFIRHDSIMNGDDYHWQIDDDVRSFFRRAPTVHSRIVPVNEILTEIQEFVARFKNIGQAGTNQNSWPPTNKYLKVNNLPVQCVLNNNRVSGVKYRQPILCDMDYTLQVLRAGWCTIMFDHLRTNCPPVGSNQGGLQDFYQKQDVIRRVMDDMCAEFGTMSVGRDDKGWHLDRNEIWATFPQRPIPVRSEDLELTS